MKPRRMEREPKFQKGDLVDAEVGNPQRKRWIRGGEVKRVELRDNGSWEYYVAYVEFPANGEVVVYTENQLAPSEEA